MTNTANLTTIEHRLQGLARRWRVVAGTTALGLGVGSLVIAATPRRWQASADLLLRDASMQSVQIADRQLHDEVLIIGSDDVRAAAGAATPAGAPSPRSVRVSTPVERADLVRLTVEGPDRKGVVATLRAHIAAYDDRRWSTERSRLVAEQADVDRQIAVVDKQLVDVHRPLDDLNQQRTAAGDPAARAAVEAQLADVSARLQPQLAALTASKVALDEQLADVRARQADLRGRELIVTAAPRASSGPVQPATERILVVALVLGLAAGIALASFAQETDRHVHDASTLADVTGAPVLATVRTARRRRRSSGSPLVMCRNEGSDAAQVFHRLSAVLRHTSSGPLVVAVTSPSDAERRDCIAANLAVAVARQGRTVVLVDGELRSPNVHALTAVAPAPGLADVLGGQAELALVPSPSVSGLSILPAGNPAAAAPSALASAPFEGAIRSLARTYDVVIVDLPSVFVDSAIVATAAANVVVLVCRQGVTGLRDARRATDALHAVSDATVVSILEAPARRRERRAAGAQDPGAAVAMSRPAA